MTHKYNFDTILDRSALSTMKWNSEIARTGHQDLLSFGTADMDFQSPPEVVKALIACAERGHFGYPWKGPQYYEAVMGYLARRFEWKVERAWIDTAAGVYASMQPVLGALTQPGDEVIIQTPVHHIFRELVVAMGRVVVENPLDTDGNTYSMDLEDLQSRITERTKVLLLCSPHNPMGRIWRKTELEALYDVCLCHNIVVISDEIYSGLLYPKQAFVPAATISRAASLSTVTLISASKSFNMTGLKHSLVVTENEAIRDAFRREQKCSNMYYGGSTFGQIATEVTFRECDSWSDELIEYVQKNAEFFRSGLAEIFPFCNTYQAEATYFLWVDFSAYGLRSEDVVKHLQDQAHIIVTGGHTLGLGGEGHVRWNLGCPRSILAEALDRLRKAGLPEIAIRKRGKG